MILKNSYGSIKKINIDDLSSFTKALKELIIKKNQEMELYQGDYYIFHLSHKDFTNEILGKAMEKSKLPLKSTDYYSFGGDTFFPRNGVTKLRHDAAKKNFEVKIVLP